MTIKFIKKALVKIRNFIFATLPNLLIIWFTISYIPSSYSLLYFCIFLPYIIPSLMYLRRKKNQDCSLLQGLFILEPAAVLQQVNNARPAAGGSRELVSTSLLPSLAHRLSHAFSFSHLLPTSALYPNTLGLTQCPDHPPRANKRHWTPNLKLPKKLVPKVSSFLNIHTCQVNTFSLASRLSSSLSILCIGTDVRKRNEEGNDIGHSALLYLVSTDTA